MILILNCGSQSIKWKLFNQNLFLLKKGRVDVKDAKKYRHFLIGQLKQIREGSEGIEFVGHRVVHGGPKFKKPAKVDKKVLREIEKHSPLAPLHNPFNVLGIKLAQKVFPESKHFAVFDTEFFKNLPLKAKTYPLPDRIRKKYFFERFGFHGLSHQYAAGQGAEKIKKLIEKLKIISCHLGGGASITAIRNGRPVDTSMGLTPLEGLVMMTRPGSLDPGLVLSLAQDAKIKKEELVDILNRESGVKGIAGSADMKSVLRLVEKGDEKAKLALDIFVYSIQKYIGAYFVVLGGCDLLIFTGAIGFGSAKIRKMILKPLKILKNAKILAIETNEELLMAQKIKDLV